jgi:acyl carrier protein
MRGWEPDRRRWAMAVEGEGEGPVAEGVVDGHTVLGLLTDRLAVVLAIDAANIRSDSRFDEDLHADSLDLVEVVESVERILAEQGVHVSLPDEELVTVKTVSDAAERIAAGARPRR